jgi:hypothetical protein
VFRHVALFRFTDDSSEQQHRDVIDTLRGLPAIIPEIRDYHIGLDAGLVDGNWHAAVVADFDDESGWRTYTADAEHQRIIAEQLRPILADRAAVQYEL